MIVLTKTISKRVLSLAFFLVFAILAIYIQTARFDFLSLDVEDYLTKNEIIQQGVSLSGLRYAFVTMQTGDWQPLVWISWMMDCQLFGMNAGAHHLMNVFYHMVNVLLLFWVLYEMTGSVWKSWMVAALWAVHPMHVESVAWVAGRKDTLSGLFWLLTMLAYTRHVKQKGKFRWVIIFYVCAVLSKPMVVTLPFVLLLLDYWPLKRKEKLSELIKEKTSLFLLSAFSCFMAYQANAQMRGIYSFEETALGLRAQNAIVAYGFYLWKTFLPFHLSYFYPFPEQSYPASTLILAITVVFLISILIYFFHKRLPGSATGWVFFLITLLPVIGLIRVGGQAYADRYTYIPHMGLFIAIVWFLFKPQQKSIIPSTMVVTFILIFTGLSFREAQAWENDIRLNRNVLRKNPNNYFAHHNLAQALARNGDLPQALQHYETSLQLKPNQPDVLNNLGSLVQNQGQLILAKMYYQKALEIDPSHLSSANNLGLILLEEGDLEEASKQFETIIQMNSRYAPAYKGLAEVHRQKGHLKSAIEQAVISESLNPYDEVTHGLLGLLYALKAVQEATEASRLNDLRLARRHLQTALNLNPNFEAAKINLLKVEKQIG